MGLLQGLNARLGKLIARADCGARDLGWRYVHLQTRVYQNVKDKTSPSLSHDVQLAVIKSVKLKCGTDLILYDPCTKRVFPSEREDSRRW